MVKRKMVGVQQFGESVDLKLKELKFFLASWNKTCFGDIDRRINEIEKEIEDEGLSEDQLKRRNLSSSLWEWHNRRAALWRQKSRC